MRRSMSRTTMAPRGRDRRWVCGRACTRSRCPNAIEPGTRRRATACTGASTEASRGRAASAGSHRFYNGTLDAYALAVDPAHPGTLYAGTATGTYKSTNRGDDWMKVDFAPHMKPILSQQARLVVDGNGWVLLGNDDGIRRSRDGGATWTDMSSGLSKGPTGHYGP